jgi:hypothetical protein
MYFDRTSTTQIFKTAGVIGVAVLTWVLLEAFMLPGAPSEVPCVVDGRVCEQRRKCTECTVCTAQNDQCCCLHVDECKCAIIRNGAGQAKRCCK